MAGSEGEKVVSAQQPKRAERLSDPLSLSPTCTLSCRMGFCRSCGTLLDLSRERCTGCALSSQSSFRTPLDQQTDTRLRSQSPRASEMPPRTHPQRWTRGPRSQSRFCWPRNRSLLYGERQKQSLLLPCLSPCCSPPVNRLSLRRYCTPPPNTSPRTSRSRTTSATTPTQPPSSRLQTTPTATPVRTRHLSNLSRPTSPPAPPLSPPHAQDSGELNPIVPTHTGSSTHSSQSLQKVFGSVLQERTPESARCLSCRVFFGRQAGEEKTIYPVPGSDPLS